MNRLHLTAEGWAYVLFAFLLIVALWFARELKRQATIRRELMRRDEEGRAVRLQQADGIESCNIGAAQARRSRS